jgi:hypothetical protein
VRATEFLWWGFCKLEQGILVYGFRNMYNYLYITFMPWTSPL